MKKYNEVEGILYSHYRKKNKIGIHKGALARTENRIKQIQYDLATCNIDIKDDLTSVTYDEEKITTSSNNISSMEKALIRAESKLERELKEEVNYKNKLKEKIRKAQKKIDEIEILLEDLTEEEMQIVEKKYSGKVSDRRIGIDINLERSTVARKRKNIIETFMKFL